MTKHEQATAMASARLWHKRRGTVENVQLAIDIGLVIHKDAAIELCHSLGLYAYCANDTKLQTMTDYIKENEL